MDPRFLIQRWQRIGFGLELLMAKLTLGRVRAVRKDAFHPFVKEKLRAIDEFVEHSAGR
jgi:hypothetical protein